MITHINASAVLPKVKFEKTGAEIKFKVDLKIVKLLDKIEERKKRIADIRKHNNISDEDLIELLSDHARESFSNTGIYNLRQKGNNPERLIPAGVINQMDTENRLKAEEEEHVERLSLISRNINTSPGSMFEVSYQDLEYLEF